jgi:uncharacterized protein (TIGR02757 family)
MIGSARLPAKRLAAIGRALDAVRSRCEVAVRRASDPVEFVHRYDRPDDRELAGLVAATLAFGNVKALRAKIADALDRLGPELARTCDDPRRVGRLLAGWKHRLYTGDDLAALLVGARCVQREAGSLGIAFAEAFEREGELRAALGGFVDRIRAGGLARRTTRGARHLLPDPAAGSANKRLLLYLRWMVRPADGVDLGLWDVPAARLVVPLDVHIHKLARNLGFTRRPTADWRAALDVTAHLARLDPEDPVKYDFSLCHLGMVQRCPSRADPVRCEGCGVRPVCRHWANARGPREELAAKAGSFHAADAPTRGDEGP